MKIVHIHLLGPYTDGWGYQENVLPRVQAYRGDMVYVITNCMSHDKNGTITAVSPGKYQIDGVEVIRLKEKAIVPHNGIKSYVFDYAVYPELLRIVPDIILLHGLGKGNVNYQVRRYLRKHKECYLFGDSHVLPENNEGLKTDVIHKLLLKYVNHTRKILYPFYQKIFGITPACIDFAVKNYETPVKKMELFPLGFDPQICDLHKKKIKRKIFRNKWGIDENEIVIIHGGKIIPRRNTLLAIDAVRELRDLNVKMVIFGAIDDEIKEKVMSKIEQNKECVLYLGHLEQKEYISAFMASDIGFFPGAQSALWQEAIGCGLPLLVGKSEGIDYLDCGGNILFVNRDNVKDSIKKLREIITSNYYKNMTEVAEKKGHLFFSYERIGGLMKVGRNE